MASFLFSACSSNKMIGLWQVEKVQIEEQEMTPVARWVRMDKNGNQASGNGWYQHSYGTWTYEPGDKALAITNENGFEDPFGPFTCIVKGDEMTWKRKEEGQTVNVILKKMEALPAAPADQLLGIWDLVKAIERGEDQTEAYDFDQKYCLFLRWDRNFVIPFSENGRQMGVYAPNGHRSQVQFIYNGTEANRVFWEYEVTKDELVLKNNADQIELYFERIYQIPR